MPETESPGIIRLAWTQFVSWVDWHGRGATLLTAVIAFGGAGLVNRVAGIWGNVGGVYLWIVSLMAFVIFMALLLIAGRRIERHPQGAASLAPSHNQIAPSAFIQNSMPGPTFDASAWFKIQHISLVTDTVERNMGIIAAKNEPTNPAGFLAKFIGIGLIAYYHDMTWAYIFRSQILMLMDLNRRGGFMSRIDAKAHYDRAASQYPIEYGKYKFDSWMNFMIAEPHMLLIPHPGDALEITHKGRDFLKYLTHWGRTPDDRKF